MAEVVISVAAKIAESLVETAVRNLCWFGGRSRVRLVQRLSEKIPTILDVLEDAEKRQVNDPAVKEWLESIKDVYYDVINLLEELSFVEMKLREKKKVPFLGLPLSLWNSFRQCVVDRDAVRKMRRMLYEIDLLLKNKDELVLHQRSTQAQPSMVKARQERPATASLVHEQAVYGRDDERRVLISMLLNEDEGGQAQAQKDIQYISVVGMAGIGKTLLAQLVYANPKVETHFHLRTWIYVSGEFSVFQIAEAFVESVASTTIDEVELESLIPRIRQIIVGKRYLLVLDGVRNEDDSTKWQQLEEVFNCGAPGSTILITTRNEKDAVIAGSKPKDIMHLTVLSDQDCWSIIRDQAFGTSIDRPETQIIFNEVGRDIVKRCQGLPLIAKSLGGILRGSTDITDWQQVLDSDVWELLPKGSADLTYSLMLSYYLLPPVLRQCLLYCSIFPKNHYIDVDKLIKLWMAQDFVASDQHEMEAEGWRSFKGLLDRSIFQEFKQDDNGNFKFKLEGAMTDFIQFLAQNECHIMLLDYKTELGENNHVPEKARHCTLNVEAQASLPSSIANTKKLHTLMILSEYSSIDPTTLTSLLSHMRRLQALDLSSCSMNELPLKVGELLHLRYLDLSFNRDLKKLPQAICNLFNLQTLNLNGCDSLRKLPKGVGKLTKLRHLEILWTTSLSYLPKGIASLTSLRTLNRFFGISGVGSGACNLGDLETLTYLQGCMSIDGLGGETGVYQAGKANLKNKKDLRGLELWFSVVGSERDDQDLLKALEAPPGLECLGIFNYRGNSFPNWMTALVNLRHLMLADCSKCVILPPLGQLPSLESLEIKNMSHVKKLGSEFLGIRLDDADGGEEGSSSAVAFPELKKLRFQMLDNWEEWVGMTDEGGHANIMPSLSFLSIVSCAKIRAVPNYIKTKENLKLVIKECPFLEQNPEDDR